MISTTISITCLVFIQVVSKYTSVFCMFGWQDSKMAKKERRCVLIRIKAAVLTLSVTKTATWWQYAIRKLQGY